ncbi:MAG: efflux RND transporter periplasmic adaptor subunit [Acidobacteriota bacterium]
MKRRIYACLVLALLGAGCRPGSTEPPAADSPGGGTRESGTPEGTVQVAAAALEQGLVQTARVAPQKWARVLDLPAEVRRNEDRTMRVGTAVEGRVVRMFATVGSQVRENDLLAQLRSVTIDDLRARLAQALAELERCRSQLELAQAAWNRAQRLLELRVGSMRAVEQARAELHAAEAEVRVAEAEVARIEENLEHLGVPTSGATEEYSLQRESEEEHGPDYGELELVPIRAPIGGTVVERRITLGSVVSPADDLFTISDLRLVWVEAALPGSELGRVKVGDQAHIASDAFPDRVFQGRLVYVADEADPLTRTARIRCEVHNPDGMLRPGMLVRAQVMLAEAVEVLAVPRVAVQQLEQGDAVFVQVGEGSFVPRIVTLGETRGDWTEIVAGLEVGETIATEGSFLLKAELLRAQLEEE